MVRKTSTLPKLLLSVFTVSLVACTTVGLFVLLFKGELSVIEVCTVLIAGAALIVTLRSDQVNRTHAKLSVQPNLSVLLEWGGVKDKVTEVTLRYRNFGLGSSKIEWIAMEFDSKPIHDWNECMKLMGLSAKWTDKSWIINLPKDVLIPSGTDEVLLEIRSAREANIFAGAYDRLNIKICYSSMYGDRWQYERIGNITTANCDPDPEIQFGW